MPTDIVHHLLCHLSICTVQLAFSEPLRWLHPQPMISVPFKISVRFYLDFGNPYATSYLFYVRMIPPKSLDGGTQSCCDTQKSICEQGRKYSHHCYYGQRFALLGRAQDSGRCCILRLSWRLWLSSTSICCFQWYMVCRLAMHTSCI